MKEEKEIGELKTLYFITSALMIILLLICYGWYSEKKNKENFEEQIEKIEENSEILEEQEKENEANKENEVENKAEDKEKEKNYKYMEEQITLMKEQEGVFQSEYEKLGEIIESENSQDIKNQIKYLKDASEQIALNMKVYKIDKKASVENKEVLEDIRMRMESYYLKMSSTLGLLDQELKKGEAAKLDEVTVQINEANEIKKEMDRIIDIETGK